MVESHHMGVFVFSKAVLFYSFSFFLLLLREKLRVGTLNINRGRDKNNRLQP